MNRTPTATRLAVVSLALAALAGCGKQLRVLAESDDLQWTGVAVTDDDRLFVNYPRWSDRYEMAIGEVIDGEAQAYPNAVWNDWPEGGPWRNRFVAVQSIHVDRQGRMWALDTGRVSEADGRHAAVYEIDPGRDEVVRTIVLPFDVAPEGSYINDIRVSPDGRHAFISESGLGSIIVLDTATGEVRRVLAAHPSTKGSADRVPVVEGKPWVVRETGEPNVVHCDGIAVSPSGTWVYYKAISADDLYRVPAALLTDPRAYPADGVQNLGPAPITDGMIFDDRGNLYFSALEHDAIMYRTPEGTIRTLVSDPRIAWPDSFAIDRARNRLVFTTAQIHRTPRFSADGSWPDEPYRVWSVRLAD